MRFFCTIFRIFYTLVEIQAFVFPITAPFLYIKSFSGWFDVFYLYINLDTKDYGSMIMGLENINIKDMIYKLIMKWKNGDDAWWTTRCTSSTYIHFRFWDDRDAAPATKQRPFCIWRFYQLNTNSISRINIESERLIHALYVWGSYETCIFPLCIIMYTNRRNHYCYSYIKKRVIGWHGGRVTFSKLTYRWREAHHNYI